MKKFFNEDANGKNFDIINEKIQISQMDNVVDLINENTAPHFSYLLSAGISKEQAQMLNVQFLEAQIEIYKNFMFRRIAAYFG